MANPSLQIGNDNWAIKEDNLLGYSTAGTRFVPQPITMTRATLGTRVNPSGLVEDVALLGSEEVTNGDFAIDGTPSTNTWTLGWYSNTANVSISGGKITLTNSSSESDSRAYATNGVSSNNILITNQLYKLQYEVIANNGVTSFKYYSSSGVFIDAPIDLGVTHTIYIKNTSNQLFLFQNATTNSNISLDNVSVKEATIDNLPRVDYTDGTSSLLAEPQRTNTITYSSDFSQWTIDGNASITSNATTSPDGTENATKLIAGSSSGRQAIKLNNTSSGDLAVSVFAKKGEYSVIQLSDARNATAFINFDLLNGSVGSSSVMTGEIVSLGNDWYKCIATYNSASNIISMRLSIAESSTSARLVNFSGNGTDGLYIWGAQVEESYPTSYIPTSGSTVTRNQETYTKTGISDKINSEEGVLFAEMAALSNDGTIRYLSINDGTSNNRVTFLYYSSNTNIRVIVSSGGTNVMDKNSGVSSTLDFHKVAIKWKENDFAFWLDGVKVQTDTSGLAPIGLNTLSFDVAGSGNFFGKVKQLQIFKTALTDSELATLTT
jgi:Fe-S cluster assembly iron-binding protein IscA